MSLAIITGASGGIGSEFARQLAGLGICDEFWFVARSEEKMQKLADELGIGVPTLNDIVSELIKPGRDPRDELPPQILRTDAMDISSLKTGMEFIGTVRNVADFGAFVDIGVHQDGLVHISKLSDKFVKRASDVVKVGDIIKVRVIDVDVAKKRISLEKIK